MIKECNLCDHVLVSPCFECPVSVGGGAWLSAFLYGCLFCCLMVASLQRVIFVFFFSKRPSSCHSTTFLGRACLVTAADWHVHRLFASAVDRMTRWTHWSDSYPLLYTGLVSCYAEVVCVLGPMRFIFPSSKLDEIHLFLFFPLDFCAMFSPVDASHFICDSLIRECSARCERWLFHTTYMLT